MSDIYIERELSVNEDGNERSIAEADILSIGLPLVILGDPGLGKSKLTESIAVRIGGRRISAGSFIRNANPEALMPSAGIPIIIDGLDELTASTSASPVDEVLKKLSAMGYPPFILSCRAADWSGSADRQKILEDYGVSPITLRLEAFSRADARRFLNAHGEIDTDQLLDELDRRD